MNQSKAITLDAVLREAILRDITKIDTKKPKPELTLDSVLHEAFKQDAELNKLVLTEAVNATKIANQIYNAKGVVYDDEKSAISAIKSIRNVTDWFAVRKKFYELHNKYLQEYLNSFLSTDDLDVVVSHLLDILPKKYWESQTSLLKSRIRPYDPATGKQQINISRTPERTLKDKNVSAVSGYIDAPVVPTGIVHSSPESQQRIRAALGKSFNPQEDTIPWKNKARETALKKLGAKLIYGGNVNTKGKYARQYALMVYSNPAVEKKTTKDQVVFSEQQVEFGNFPGQQFNWKLENNEIKLYMPSKPTDPEGKIIKKNGRVTWIDNLVSISGQQYRVDDAGNITAPGQGRKWKEIRTYGDYNWQTREMDRLQTLFDWVGLIPVIGDFIDVINAAISFGRGRTFEGLLSLIAVIPVAGSVAVLGAKKLLKSIRQILAKHKALKLLNISDDAVRKAEFKKLFEKAVREGGRSGRQARELLEMVSQLNKYRKAFRSWRVTFVRGLNKYKWIPGISILSKSTDAALALVEKEFNDFCKDIGKSADEVISATAGTGKKSAAGKSGKDAIEAGVEAEAKQAAGIWKRNLDKIRVFVTKGFYRLPKSFRMAQANAIAKWFRNLVTKKSASLWKTILKTLPAKTSNELVKSLIFNERYVSHLSGQVKQTLKANLGLIEFDQVQRAWVNSKLGERLLNNTASIDELLTLVSKATDDSFITTLYKDNMLTFKNLIVDKAMELNNVVYKEFAESWIIGFISYIKRDVPLNLPYWKSAAEPASKYIPDWQQLKSAYAPEWGNIWKASKRADVIYNEYQDAFEKYGFDVDTPNGVIVSMFYHALSYVGNLNHYISQIFGEYKKSEAGQNDKVEAGKTILGADRLAHGELPSKLREPVKK